MPDTIEISRAEYESLLSAQAELSDIAAFDRAMTADEDALPHEFMKRLINGENALLVFRSWRGLNQSELSRASGVHRTQIADIEAGRSNGSVDTMKKLAEALDVMVDELV